jgi:hypothetical protein
MHMKPVKRGLVSQPKEWPWSSFSFYSIDEMGLTRIDPCLLIYSDLVRKSKTPPLHKPQGRGTRVPRSRHRDALQSFAGRLEFFPILPIWRVLNEEQRVGNFFGARWSSCDFRAGIRAPRGGALEHGRVGNHQRAGEGVRLAESSSIASS